MGLLTILKKVKQKERELRILILGLDNAGSYTYNAISYVIQNSGIAHYSISSSATAPFIARTYLNAFIWALFTRRQDHHIAEIQWRGHQRGNE
jgi:hypothetical protein